MCNDTVFSSLKTRFDVSRETFEILTLYVEELLRWQKVHNLISDQTRDEIWERHIADSLQMVTLAPQDAKKWVDIGAGAGLPGLVVAIALKARLHFEMHLIESHHRKCAFLRTIALKLNLPVTVHCKRIESILPNITLSFDVMSARALSTLDALLGYAEKCVIKPKLLLFPKGKTAKEEILIAQKKWEFNQDAIQSVTDSAACILSISKFQRVV
jgi:16S rRNA (guanine527-N7)-methyltransferase